LNHVILYFKHDTDYFYYSLHGSSVSFNYRYFSGNKAPEKIKQLQISTKIPHLTMQLCNYASIGMKAIKKFARELLRNSFATVGKLHTEEVFTRETAIVSNSLDWVMLGKQQWCSCSSSLKSDCRL